MKDRLFKENLTDWEGGSPSEEIAMVDGDIPSGETRENSQKKIFRFKTVCHFEWHFEDFVDWDDWNFARWMLTLVQFDFDFLRKVLEWMDWNWLNWDWFVGKDWLTLRFELNLFEYLERESPIVWYNLMYLEFQWLDSLWRSSPRQMECKVQHVMRCSKQASIVCPT